MSTELFCVQGFAESSPFQPLDVPDCALAPQCEMELAFSNITIAHAGNKNTEPEKTSSTTLGWHELITKHHNNFLHLR